MTMNNNINIRQIGRPANTVKNVDRRRVQNPYGRWIDFEGPQYKKLFKNGYILENNQLIKDVNFIPPETVLNPKTNRNILKNSLTLKKLLKNGYKLNYSENKLKVDKKLGV